LSFSRRGPIPPRRAVASPRRIRRRARELIAHGGPEAREAPLCNAAEEGALVDEVTVDRRVAHPGAARSRRQREAFDARLREDRDGLIKRARA